MPFIINRFAFAHLHGKCRRSVILEYFGEEMIDFDDGEVCCDVCAGVSSQPMVNCLNEMQAVVRAVEELPNLGEIKVIFTYMQEVVLNIDTDSHVDPWFRTATNCEDTKFRFLFTNIWLRK